MQILLTAAYDGTRYAGWQRQTNGLAVQQVLEEALAKLLSRPVIIRAASRTDAGVHALGQRAAFDADGLKIPVDKLPCVLNGYLPSDVSVTAAEIVPDDFNPRYNTRCKTYRYQYYNAPCPNPLLGRYSAFVPCPLDADAMIAAAPLFVGRRDFSALRNASSDWVINANGDEPRQKSAVREIFACTVEKQGPLLTLTVVGDGFLYNMVRILAGTLLYAGLGKITPGDVPAILASKNRTRAGKTMPPEGLTLMEVVY